MLNKKRKYKKKEDGQAMLEFVLVLPVFMLIISIILDFGWLFYNQMQLENASRNAARILCVEYDKAALNKDNLPYEVGYCEYDLQTMKDKADPERPLSDQEIRALNEVVNSKPSSVSNITVQVKFTYDDTYLQENGGIAFEVKQRSQGDVIVLVSGTHRAISPLVGWGGGDGNNMTREVSTKAVYKVEKTVTS